MLANVRVRVCVAQHASLWLPQGTTQGACLRIELLRCCRDFSHATVDMKKQCMLLLDLMCALLVMLPIKIGKLLVILLLCVCALVLCHCSHTFHKNSANYVYSTHNIRTCPAHVTLHLTTQQHSSRCCRNENPDDDCIIFIIVVVSKTHRHILNSGVVSGGGRVLCPGGLAHMCRCITAIIMIIIYLFFIIFIINIQFRLQL